MSQLYESVSAVLDGTGAAQIAVGPRGVADSWIVNRITVNGNSTAQPQLLVYKNNPAPSCFVDGTTTANQDVDEITNPLMVANTERLIFQWSQGSAGAQMTVVIEGTL